MSKEQRTSTPTTSTAAPSTTKAPATQPATSNTAMLEQVGAAQAGGAVDGPMGKVFVRIAGSAAAPGFDRTQLHNYLDKTLKLADGEWFRGAKLDGVADTLMAQLDVNKDGLVSWAEFKAFEAQTLATVAPGAKDEASARTAAGGRFDKLDSSRDGQLNYDELNAGTMAELPKGTDHADLISQLAARIALDAVDTDQGKSPVKNRTLSKGEWTNAAGEMAR